MKPPTLTPAPVSPHIELTLSYDDPARMLHRIAEAKWHVETLGGNSLYRERSRPRWSERWGLVHADITALMNDPATECRLIAPGGKVLLDHPIAGELRCFVRHVTTEWEAGRVVAVYEVEGEEPR